MSCGLSTHLACTPRALVTHADRSADTVRKSDCAIWALDLISASLELLHKMRYNTINSEEVRKRFGYYQDLSCL